MIDSKVATLRHISSVQRKMRVLINQLVERANHHDESKLASPEVAFFDEFTPLLSATKYGTEEYRELLRRMQPALDHHYAVNPHHPEHRPLGIQEMSLVDLLEMICDWAAAAERHRDGDVRLSIEINQARFRYSDELKRILHNTISRLEEMPSGASPPRSNFDPSTPAGTGGQQSSQDDSAADASNLLAPGINNLQTKAGGAGGNRTPE